MRHGLALALLLFSGVADAQGFRRGRPERRGTGAIGTSAEVVVFLRTISAAEMGTGNAITAESGQALEVTRSGGRSCFNSSGVLTTIAGSGPCLTSNGIAVEGGSNTNLALWNRDWTNAVWTKTSITAAKTATGLDNTANAATTLTATSGNGTALQAFVLAAATRAACVYIKRRTGTGAIEVTANGGTNWTDVTSSISTEAWYRTLVTNTAANPSIGVRIVTSGDAIDVDYAHFEAESGGFCHTPSATTTATVFTQPEVVMRLTGTATMPTARGAFALTYTPMWGGAPAVTHRVLVSIDNSGSPNGWWTYISSGTIGIQMKVAGVNSQVSGGALTWTAGQAYRVRFVWTGTTGYIYRDGTLVTSGALTAPGGHHTAMGLGMEAVTGGATDAWIKDVCVSRSTSGCQ